MNVRVEFLLEALPPLPPIVTIFNFQLKQIIHVEASFARFHLSFMAQACKNCQNVTLNVGNSIAVLTSMKQAIRPCAELKRVEV